MTQKSVQSLLVRAAGFKIKLYCEEEGLAVYWPDTTPVEIKDAFAHEFKLRKSELIKFITRRDQTFTSNFEK